jgi:hypothetical protein
MAARLSTVRCRELLAAAIVELFRAALVGSAASGQQADPPASPELLLEEVHGAMQAALQDAAHTVAPEHQDAWVATQWEVFQEAQAAADHLLMRMHALSSRAGSPAGELEVRSSCCVAQRH